MKKTLKVKPGIGFVFGNSLWNSVLLLAVLSVLPLTSFGEESKNPAVGGRKLDQKYSPNAKQYPSVDQVAGEGEGLSQTESVNGADPSCPGCKSHRSSVSINADTVSQVVSAPGSGKPGVASPSPGADATKKRPL